MAIAVGAGPHRRPPSGLRLLVLLLALAAILVALWRLTSATDLPVQVETGIAEGGVPVTLFRPGPEGSVAPAPVVVIAHGFAGSQQLMVPFAATLARHGYIVLTFDFPGHGRNPAPLPGGLRDDRAASAALIRSLSAAEAFARAVPGGDGRVALLGHSMGGDIVLRHAVARGAAIDATIVVSTFGPGVSPTLPRNLLVVVGALEPAALREEGRRMVAQAVPGGGPVAESVTYGRFDDGTARRLVISRGVEHIGVLYGSDGLAGSATWLDRAFGRVPRTLRFVDARGPWIGLLALGLVALAWPLAWALPRAVAGLGAAGEAASGLGAGLGWRRLWPVAIGPALATPLLLRLVPTDTLPLLLGDYMLAHFALYGVLTALALRLAGAGGPFGDAVAARTAWGAVLLGGGLVGAYGILVIGLALDREVVSFWPVGVRWWLVPAMLAGTLAWFLADEWATRGPGSARGAYAVTKLCFLLSLALAIALDLQRLFFLIIILPVILVLFLAYGLIGRWTWRATGHPFVAGVGNAAMLAWAIGTIFPLVAR